MRCFGGATGLSAKAERALPGSWIGNLKRQTVFPQFFPALPPALMQRALGIIRGGLRAGELDGIHAVKVAHLIAFRLQPNVPDSRNFSGHGLDARQSQVFVVLRSGVLPLINHHVNHGLRLPEFILRRHASRALPCASRNSCGEERGSGRHCRGTTIPKLHDSSPLLPVESMQLDVSSATTEGP